MVSTLSSVMKIFAHLHADVAGIVEREHHRLAQILLDRVAPVEGVDAHDLHGAEHGIEQDLADEHLGHGSDGVTLAVIRNLGIG
jgi:hypothetical protein